MKTTLQTGLPFLDSRHLSGRGCGNKLYVTGPPGIFCLLGNATTGNELIYLNVLL